MKRAREKNNNNKDFQLWQLDNHPVLLKDAELAHQKLDFCIIIRRSRDRRESLKIIYTAVQEITMA